MLTSQIWFKNFVKWLIGWGNLHSPIVPYSGFSESHVSSFGVFTPSIRSSLCVAQVHTKSMQRSKLMHGFPIWLRVTFLCEPTIVLPVYQKWEVLHLRGFSSTFLLFPAFFPQISLIYTLYWFEHQWKEQQSIIDNPIGGGFIIVSYHTWHTWKRHKHVIYGSFIALYSGVKVRQNDLEHCSRCRCQ